MKKTHKWIVSLVSEPFGAEDFVRHTPNDALETMHNLLADAAREQAHDSIEREIHVRLPTAKKALKQADEIRVQAPEFIRRIAWKELRCQKIWLAEQARVHKNTTEAAYTEGLLTLLDALQDWAVDEAHFPELLVFGRIANPVKAAGP